jgi:glycosyltransferase involved in cell wall biosynthesis
MNRLTRITVVLCTYNRARILAKALESVATQAMPQSVGWETLVVDNNSTDDTPHVVEDFQRRYPERIRYLFEPQQGLSYARNAGIREARGDILAFIDDDETADPRWLENLTANLHSGEWAGAGGRVLTQWNGPRPPWLALDSSFTLGPLGFFDPGTEEGQITLPPVGGNMAFRREVFEIHGGFRTDLGRSGSSLMSCEEIEFGRRLMAAGQRLRYEPSAITYQATDERHLRKKYFLRWWFDKGRSDVKAFGIPPNAKRLLGVPVELIRCAAVEGARWMVAANECGRFICRLKICCYAGHAYESYRQSRETKKMLRKRGIVRGEFP